MLTIGVRASCSLWISELADLMLTIGVRASCSLWISELASETLALQKSPQPI
jgi:hypothetical protein